MFFDLTLSTFVLVVSWPAALLHRILQKNNTCLFCLLTRSSNPTAPLTHNQNLRVCFCLRLFFLWYKDLATTLTPWKLDRAYDPVPSKYIPWLSITPASFIFHENCSSASSIYATFLASRITLRPSLSFHHQPLPLQERITCMSAEEAIQETRPLWNFDVAYH